MEAIGRILRAIVLAVSFATLVASNGEAASVAGLQISNTITATYADVHGATYDAESNTIVVTINAVGAMTVSPKETAVNPLTESFPVGATIVRTFTISNAGNSPDAYTIAAASTGAGTVTSVAFIGTNGLIPVTIGTTISPTVAAGASIQVQVTCATTGVATNSAFPITLTARSTSATANGLVSDSGREWGVGTPAAVFSGLTGPKSAIAKLVNSEPSTAAAVGQTVSFSISFENVGGASATDALVTDDVPVGLTPILSSVSINGTNEASAATLSGQNLSVKAGLVPLNTPETLTFNALVSSDPAGSTYMNIASVGADGLTPSKTSPASVFVGAANVVYDGYAGQNTRVSGATLTLRDEATESLVQLPQGAANSSSSARATSASSSATTLGVPPNSANTNPYVTGSDGSYSFVFGSQQLGTSAQPATYELDVSASGYQSRRIGISLASDSTGVLYDVTLHALDGQQLAQAGTFLLTTHNVTLDDVLGLLGNIPLFEPHPLEVTKTVDRTVASSGDRLFYTVQFGTSGASFGATRIVDTLPPGVVYGPGSARLDNDRLEPAVSGRVLTWTLPSMTSSHTLTYAAVVMPSVVEGSTLINLVDVNAATGAGGTVTGSATADTSVVAGALGDRIVITGRVFSDVAGTGHFTRGDLGLGNVRVYLEDGEYVLTDLHGRFTFPAVDPGEHVLRVDETSLPAGVRPYRDRRYDSTRSLQQLLHGIFDAGLMQDVEFAVEPVPPS